MRSVCADVESALHKAGDRITLSAEHAELLLKCTEAWCNTTETIWFDEGALPRLERH